MSQNMALCSMSSLPYLLVSTTAHARSSFHQDGHAIPLERFPRHPAVLS